MKAAIEKVIVLYDRMTSEGQSRLIDRACEKMSEGDDSLMRDIVQLTHLRAVISNSSDRSKK
mgnify:CR=1 FL=1